MYVNKCIKCGKEFETKNPKRVICPDCLYPEKKMLVEEDRPTDNVQVEGKNEEGEPLRGYSAGPEETPRNYSAGGENSGYRSPQRGYNQGGYDRDNRPGGYNQGGYNRDNRSGGYNQGGYNRDNRSG
ncbi:MAG: hypothetical protein R3Y28_06295, partial [Candidatus Gastranaerophilales bacterium]